MDHTNSKDNVWLLSSSQLSERIQALADGPTAKIGAVLCAEAGRLCANWRDALKPAEKGIENQSPRALRLAAVRKRSIQILLQVG